MFAMSGVYIWINIDDDEHDDKSLIIVYMKILFDIKTSWRHWQSLSSQDNCSIFDWFDWLAGC